MPPEAVVNSSYVPDAMQVAKQETTSEVGCFKGST